MPEVEPGKGGGGEADLPRIAVVAVHGIAAHKPGESARKVADLLVGYKRADRGDDDRRSPTQQYTPFARESLHLKVRPMGLEPDGPTLRSGDVAFSRELLRHYGGAGGEEVYETVRFTGRRIDENAHAQASIHVYEMFYDDLAALRGGFLRVFGELYQLLFHLSNLGRDTILRARNHDLAEGQDAAEEGATVKKDRWAGFLECHNAAAFCLTVPFPMLNLLMLATLLPLLVVSVPASMRPYLVVIAPLVLVGVGVAAFTWGRLRDAEVGGRVFWWLAGLLTLPVLGLAGWGLTVWASPPDEPLPLLKWLALEAVLALYVGVGIIGNIYAQRFALGTEDRARGGPTDGGPTDGGPTDGGAYADPVRRRGVHVVTFGGTAVFFALFLWRLRGVTDTPSGIATALLATLEPIYALLLVAWSGFAVMQLAARLVGLRVAWRHAPGRPRHQADQVAWTSAISLSITAPLLLVLTLVAWGALKVAVGPLLFEERLPTWPEAILFTASEDRSAPLAAALYRPWLLSSNILFRGQNADPIPAAMFLERMLLGGATSAFPYVVGSLVVALLLMVWALFPSVLSETRAFHTRGDENARTDLSRRYGAWLSNGWTLNRLAGEIVFWTSALVLPGGFVLDLLNRGLSPPVYNERLFALLGTAVAASTVGVLALGRRLDSVASLFYPVLDAALDVDKHLRTQPQEAPPRARMFARYASLLRFLYRREGPGSRGYDAVILVAHSQGSVLTADLLRLIASEREASRAAASAPVEPSLHQFGGAGGLPVCLFTMGCPLRQLYARRFPNLYSWAFHDGGPPPAPRAPDPDALGVDVWVNAYRSGDYVGRFLWAAWDENPWDYDGRPRFSGPRRWEFCIGPGGHTRYWDSSAPEIAAALDDLIATFADPSRSQGHIEENRAQETNA